MGYFEEAVQTGQPIVPPAPPAPVQAQAEAVASVTSVAPEYKGLPVRASGDRVFILLKGKKYWVTSPEALTKLGFKLGDEVKIDQETLDIIPEGEPIR